MIVLALTFLMISKKIRITGGYEMHIQSPWYEEIMSGRKTIEGRAGSLEKYNHLIGKVISITNGKEYNNVRVTDIKHYNSLEEYIKNSGWNRIAPHTKSEEETFEAYYKIYDRNGNQVFSETNVKKRGGMNAIYLSSEI